MGEIVKKEDVKHIETFKLKEGNIRFENFNSNNIHSLNLTIFPKKINILNPEYSGTLIKSIFKQNNYSEIFTLMV